MTVQEPRSRQPKQLDAGILQAEISSFALRLGAEGKAAKTIRTYAEAVRWFAAARLPGQTSWILLYPNRCSRWRAATPERGYGPLRRPRLNGAGGCVSSSGSQVHAPTASTAASAAATDRLAAMCPFAY
jgi:hypothetical protein